MNTSLPAPRGLARSAVSILRNRVYDDGPRGVSYFSTVHEPRLAAAVRRLIARGVLARVDAPRGEIAATPGPRWNDIPHPTYGYSDAQRLHFFACHPNHRRGFLETGTAEVIKTDDNGVSRWEPLSRC